MAQESMVNGIPVDKLTSVIDVLKGNKEAAQFTFRAKNRWAGGAAAFTSIQDFSAAGQEDISRPYPFVMEAGEPEVLLGIDNAPNATEALLHALACCLNASFIFHAAARGVTVQELELDMEGDLDIRGFLGIDDKVRNGYNQIRVLFKVKADASEEQVRELVQLAQKRSPVFDIVTHEVPVNASMELVGAGTEHPVQASI
ncbi:MAG: OsmC family protein [Armatimonadota bacterium]|nr:OsmC family protein [bacterium]